jgi:peptidoglycan/xylan/chitin deacetylase (PgdA/CDA1 family)
MQYPQTLPLEDHEVVLTFDDGPLPPYSNKILDILASQCVKATYFLVGGMAHAYPDVVRRVHAEGHTIGTHSQNHPLNMRRLSDERVRAEIDDGIASVGAALGDPAQVAPFFRIPGLERSATVDAELDAHWLVTFSVDAVADDWHRHISPSEIIARGIRRLEAKGKGILLLHDIHPWTVVALPGLLKELKDHGFHIVQVVPGEAPQMIAGPTELTVAWIMAAQEAMDDGSSAPSWPQPQATQPQATQPQATQPQATQPQADVTSDRIELSAPDAQAFATDDTLKVAANTADVEDAAAETGNAAVAWPEQTEAALASTQAQLPVPSVQDIGWPVETRRIVVEPRVVEEGLPRPNASGADTIDHPRIRHARLNGRRHARAPAKGQHAGLVSELLALLTPAH